MEEVLRRERNVEPWSLIGHGSGEKEREREREKPEVTLRCFTGTTESMIVLFIEIRGPGRVLDRKRMSSIWGILL